MGNAECKNNLRLRHYVAYSVRESIIMRWFLCLGLFTFVGCGATFSEPLSTSDDSRIDDRLLGEWLEVREPKDRDDPPITLSVAADQEQNSLVITSKQAGEKPDVRTIMVTYLGDRDFLSATITDKNGRTEWSIWQYQCISKDEVHLFDMQDEKVVQAIRAGHLSGKIRRVPPPFGLWGALLLKPTEAPGQMKTTRAELRDYLTRHPDDCFDLLSPFVIVRRSSNPVAD